MTKITIDRVTVEQALEALIWADAQGENWQQVVKKAIRPTQDAAAQPEQGPIGYLWPTGMHPEFRYTKQKRDGVDGTPVYTAPPAAQPEHGDIRALKYRIHELEGEVIGYKRMIEESALKKLADLGQEIEQEPVGEVLNERGEIDYISYVPPVGTRLYTAPSAAQRKPLPFWAVQFRCRKHLWIHLSSFEDAYMTGFRDAETAHGIKESK